MLRCAGAAGRGRQYGRRPPEGRWGQGPIRGVHLHCHPPAAAAARVATVWHTDNLGCPTACSLTAACPPSLPRRRHRRCRCREEINICFIEDEISVKMRPCRGRVAPPGTNSTCAAQWSKMICVDTLRPAATQSMLSDTSPWHLPTPDEEPLRPLGQRPPPRAPTSRPISGEIFSCVSWDSLAHRRRLTRLRSGTPNRSQATGGPPASLTWATGVGATTTLYLQ